MTAYPYVGLVASASRRYRVPYPILLGLLLHEDATGARRAVSATGDYGPAQINLRSHPGVTRAQAETPGFAIPWAARYLRSLYDRCGTWQGALTQYNGGQAAGCGPSAYSRAVLSIAAQHGLRSAAAAGGQGGQAHAAPLPAQKGAPAWAWALALAAGVVLLALLVRR
jgi:hypothetical protein